MNLFARARPIERSRVEPVLAVPQRQALTFRSTDVAMLRGRQTNAEVFAPYVPPPGVLPEGTAVAMDQMPNQVFGSWLGLVADGVTFLGYPQLAEMAQREEYRLFIEVRAKEVTREWIKFQVAGDENKGDKVKRIEDKFEQLGVRNAFRQMAELDGFFGRGQIFADTGLPLGDPRLKLPLLAEPQTWRKGSLKALTVIEPIWTYPNDYNSNNPLSREFYRPQSWFVQGSIVHASRILTGVSRPVPDILKPTYNFGGLSLTQMLKPYVDNWLRTRQSISDLINSFSIINFSCDMAAIMQATLPGSSVALGSQGVLDRVGAFNAFRSNHGTFVTDKMTEELKNLAVPLSGLDKLQAQAQEQMASIASTPLIKAFGITPSGLNASSDGEIRAWYDFCESFREHLFRAHLHRVLRWVQLDLFGEVDEGITLDFIPLWQIDETGRSVISKTLADIDAQNIGAGIITPEEARERVAKDAASPYAGIDLSSAVPEPEEMDDADGLGDEPAHLLPDPAAALTGA